MIVKDHDHFIGKCQGSAHQQCNLNLSTKILAVFHNLQNYDSHLIFQEKIIFKINVIPKTIENYISFTIQQSKEKRNKPGFPLVFIDSVHF